MTAMRRTVPLAGLAGLAYCLFAPPAAADTRFVPASQLVLTDTMSEDVVVNTDPSLSGQVRVTMDGSLSCLTVVGPGPAVIGTSGCSGDDGQLRVDVPPDMPVVITSDSSGDIRVGDLHGRLVVTLNDGGDLTAGKLGMLAATIHGSGDLTVGDVAGPATLTVAGSGTTRLRSLHGPLSVQQMGSGDITVGSIETDSASIDAHGSGDMAIGPGHIGSLHARLAGSDDLAVAAVVRDADVEARGGGDVKLTRVTGALRRDASGGSDVTVGGSSKIASHARGRHVDITMGDGSSVVTHVLTAAFLVLVAFICWRIIRRGRRGVAQRSAGGAPTNTAVLALGETMTRLDQRLGKMESYVTTREFDLNRKFRELGR